MKPPKTRADRLLECRRRALDDARARLEARTRATQTAADRVLEAERTLADSRARLESSRMLRASDLFDAHEQAAASERRLLAARSRAESCEVLERQARAEVTRARTEVRKVELWREGQAAAALAAEARADRKAADEVAATRRSEGER